jgi:N-acetylmuramoyl-L-alanine amidase
MVFVRVVKGQRDCHPRRANPAALVLSLLFVLGCSGTPEVTTPLPEPAPPQVVCDETTPNDTLAHCEEEAAAEATRSEGSVEGIAAARRAAAFAVRIGRAGPSEDADDAYSRAATYLHEAARRRSIEGACEAALALAQLNARERALLSEAYTEAHRITRRFAGDESNAPCVHEAERMLAILAAHRPGASVLAAIDADPDADDPSLGLDEAADPAADSVSIEDWARAQTATEGSATLQGFAVYGERGASAARVVVPLSSVVALESSELPADGELPRRFAVMLPGTTVDAAVAASTPVGAGGVTRVRVAQDGPSARLTLDLSEEAHATMFVLPDPFRVVIDVHEGEAPLGITDPARAHALDLLVLDPGHGGNDYGARAFGLTEAAITLDLAMRVRAILRARLPATRVVLTRESDTFVSLEQRAAMANAVGASAFVSIHLNAAWEPVEHGGITTFVLDTTNDRQAIRLAARENGTSTSEVGDLSRILAGLHRDEQSTASTSLAEHIHAGTLTGGRRVLPHLHDRGVRSAMFYVLVGAVMPAVLVEASFMTREDEAEALRTERYRDAIAQGIASGIVDYAEGR